jgi:hypothetical protein
MRICTTHDVPLIGSCTRQRDRVRKEQAKRDRSRQDGSQARGVGIVQCVLSKALTSNSSDTRVKFSTSYSRTLLWKEVTKKEKKKAKIEKGSTAQRDQEAAQVSERKKAKATSQRARYRREGYRNSRMRAATRLRRASYDKAILLITF